MRWISHAGESEISLDGDGGGNYLGLESQIICRSLVSCSPRLCVLVLGVSVLMVTLVVGSH